MLAVVLILIAAALAVSAQEEAAEEAVEREDGLRVGTMAICTGIENREPVGVSTNFFEPSQNLFCFTRIEGAPDTLTVTHVWYFEDAEVGRKDLAIKSMSWRTWSSKKMLDKWSGSWRVDVLGPDGAVLRSQEFVYKPVGD